MVFAISGSLERPGRGGFAGLPNAGIEVIQGREYRANRFFGTNGAENDMK